MRTLTALLAGLSLLGMATIQAGAWETPDLGNEANADLAAEPRICFPCDLGVCELLLCIVFNAISSLFSLLRTAESTCHDVLPSACPL